MTEKEQLRTPPSEPMSASQIPAEALLDARTTTPAESIARVHGSHGRAEHAAELRQRAEEIARGKATQSPENVAAMLPDETQRLLHELRVHQIELELQNEELRRV